MGGKRRKSRAHSLCEHVTHTQSPRPPPTWGRFLGCFCGFEICVGSLLPKRFDDLSEGKRDRPRTKIDAQWFQLSSPVILLPLSSRKNIKLKRQIRKCPEVPAVTQMPALSTMGLPPTERPADTWLHPRLFPKPRAALCISQGCKDSSGGEWDPGERC